MWGKDNECYKVYWSKIGLKLYQCVLRFEDIKVYVVSFEKFMGPRKNLRYMKVVFLFLSSLC